jgi:hypothetical protein
MFQDVPIEAVRELARADRLYTGHMLSYDRILDEGLPPDTTALFIAHLEHMQSLKRLYSFFPSDHDFWKYFYDCHAETWKSIREEKLRHAHRLGNFSLAHFCVLAKGKTALLRSFSIALPFLANRREHVPRLSVSLDQHHTALVLMDDLEDWREDYRNSNFTYLLTRLIRRAGLTDQVLSGLPVSETRVGQLLYTTGLAEKQLRLAEAFFQKASDTVDNLPLPLWKHFNSGFRLRCRALRYDLAEIRRREENRVRMRKSLDPAGEFLPGGALSEAVAAAIRSGAEFLSRSQPTECGFLLARSPHMYMCPSDVVAPSKFVTSLVVRSLEPIQASASSLGPVILSASDWLVDRATTGPDPELPAVLEKAFEPFPEDDHSLSRLDGSFSPGYGPLPDGLFWANFLLACSRNSFHPPRVAAHVIDSILRKDYTPWSFGVTFGPVASPWTRYSCRPLLPLVLFCRALGEEIPRKDFQDYILQPCRIKGDSQNITETALTLLCLLLTAYDGPEIGPAVARLTEAQETDGSWAPNAVYREGTGYFGSRELTTAWCLESLHRFRVRLAKAR